MEIANAYSLIQVLVVHNEHYPEHMRRELLEGVYEIADACLQTIDAEDDAPDPEARCEIKIAANLIEKALLSGDLTEGFLVAFDCFQRAATKAGRAPR